MTHSQEALTISAQGHAGDVLMKMFTVVCWCSFMQSSKSQALCSYQKNETVDTSGRYDLIAKGCQASPL